MDKVIDVELTNRCNTVCTFCPRDKTPEQGFISIETFEKSVARIVEFDEKLQFSLCGLGEPLHPQVLDFVQYVTSQGLKPTITTNAFLLSEQLSHQLIQAGLKMLRVSISGVDGVYKKIHRLDFDKVRGNLETFRELAGDQCDLVVSITKCDQNRDDIEALKSYWTDFGAAYVLEFDLANRGGSLDLGYAFTDNKKHAEQAEEILSTWGISSTCAAPFVFLFIGWDGNYYLCCHDYSKMHPLGTVFDYSLEEIQIKKQEIMKNKPKICGNCDIDRVNIVREYLFRIENGAATKEDLSTKLSEIKEGSSLGLDIS